MYWTEMRLASIIGDGWKHNGKCVAFFCEQGRNWDFIVYWFAYERSEFFSSLFSAKYKTKCLEFGIHRKRKFFTRLLCTKFCIFYFVYEQSILQFDLFFVSTINNNFRRVVGGFNSSFQLFHQSKKKKKSCIMKQYFDKFVAFDAHIWNMRKWGETN